MNCTRCGSGSRVTETRHPDSPPRTWTGEVKKASKVVTWYTWDVVVRRRVCHQGHVWHTLELAAGDVEGMVRESRT